MRYVILTDSACDLDFEISSQPDLDFISMGYLQGSELYSHMPFDDPLAVKKFYNRQREGIPAKTSQVASSKYESVMRSWLDKGCSVLYLALSGGLSSTYQAARLTGIMLQKQYPGLRIIVIDTKATSGGMGILTERAIRNRTAGMSIQENAADLENAVFHLHHWFLVSDLAYLQRGGRISGATATAGTLFQIRPILQIDTDGKLKIIGKARGSHKAVRELTEHYEKDRTEKASDPVYVVDGDAPEIGKLIQDKLLDDYPGLAIRRCTLSPIIGAHTGPGLAAIIHIGNLS